MSVRISKRLFQRHLTLQFLHFPFEAQRNLSHRMFQKQTESVAVHHLVQSVPYCPNPHCRQPVPAMSHRTLQLLSAYSPDPLNGNRIRDCQMSSHHIQGNQACAAPPLPYHRPSESAFPLKNRRHPAQVCPDSLSSSRRSAFLFWQILRLPFAPHLQLSKNCSDANACRV